MSNVYNLEKKLDDLQSFSLKFITYRQHAITGTRTCQKSWLLRTVHYVGVLITDVIEEMQLGFVQEESGSDGMDRSISPSLINQGFV